MDEYQPIPKTPGFKDITGHKFGKWTVLGYVGRGAGASAWECRCDCGTVKTVLGNTLRLGKTNGCVCGVKRTDGLSIDSPEYSTWAAMKSRCSDPNVKSFSDYGGRGIKVCERWQVYENFLADMGPKPSPKHSIDRYPNNDGNYEPGNCRWATAQEQGRNKRQNRLVTFNGETRCVSEWCDILGLNRETVFARLRYGWKNMTEVFSQPDKRRKHVNR